MVKRVGVISLKNVFSSFPRSHQLSTTAHRGWELITPFLSMLKCWLAWSCAGLVQTTTAAESLWVHWSCHIQKTLLPSSPPQPLYLTSLLLLLPKWSWSLEEWVWYSVPLMTKHSTDSSLYFWDWGVSILTDVYCLKKLLLWDVIAALI